VRRGNASGAGGAEFAILPSMTSPTDAVPRLQPSPEPQEAEASPSRDRLPGIPGPLAIWGPVLLWMGLIFLLSARDGLDSGGGRLRFDVAKAAHLSVYFVLGLLLMRSMATVHVRRRAWWVMVVLVLYAISDEIHQAFVPGRTPLLLDIAIDATGGLIGIVVWQELLSGWLRRRGSRWAVSAVPVSAPRSAGRGTRRARR
jgi:VanZ family protein